MLMNFSDGSRESVSDWATFKQIVKDKLGQEALTYMEDSEYFCDEGPDCQDCSVCGELDDLQDQHSVLLNTIMKMKVLMDDLP